MNLEHSITSQPATVEAGGENIDLSESQDGDASLQSELIAAKKVHNGLTPLCRLPDEILTQILVHTQRPVSHDNELLDACGSGLYDFSYDQHWSSAVVPICTRIRDLAISTPELWTHVNISWPSDRIRQHLARAQALDLTLTWETFIEDVEVQADGLLRKVDAVLARVCFQKSRVANITMFDPDNPEFVELFARITQPSASIPDASALRVLRIIQEYDDGSFLGWIDAHQSLIEAYILMGSVQMPIEACLPHLMRLHLKDLYVDDHFLHVIRFLQHTPSLTELLLDGVLIWGQAEMAQTQTHDLVLDLPCLRRLVLVASPSVIRSLLTALSPVVPALRDIVVDALYHTTTSLTSFEEMVFVDLFRLVVLRWKTVSVLPFPCAQLVGALDHYSGISLRLQICTPRSSNIAPRLSFKTIHLDENPTLLSLYQQHELVIDTLRIEDLETNEILGSWTTVLDELVNSLDHMPALKMLVFNECRNGVQIRQLKAWIQRRKTEGYSVARVTFTSCDEARTRKDYSELKDSGLVEYVEWK
jgi:hypothetical protein